MVSGSLRRPGISFPSVCRGFVESTPGERHVSQFFLADWLALREPLDAKSRAASLAATRERLAAAQSHKGTLKVIDLGAGTGANLRYLAPLLGGSQEWLLVERDPLLLASLPERMRAWTGCCGLQFIESGERCAIRGAQFECGVRSVALNLATQLDQLPLSRGTLVTASALLDLVSELWLQDLAERTARVAATVWFALTYDGRIECSPAEPEDAEIRELLNAHQRTDKGFGAALGPRGGVMAEQIFAARGYRTWCAPSDWRIRPDQATLQRAVLQGWFDAACQMAADRTVALRSWLVRRQQHVEAGRSELLIGHTDMLGDPP